jgi:hypothetical protein
MEKVEFTIEKDHWGNYKLFDIQTTKNNDVYINTLVLKEGVTLNDVF